MYTATPHYTEFKALVVLSYTLTNTVSFMVACQTKVDINPPFSSLSQLATQKMRTVHHLLIFQSVTLLCYFYYGLI